MRRVFAAMIGILVSCLSFAQESELAREIIAQAPTDLFIVVTKHPSGADIVSVKARSKSYPVELLRRQCERLAKEVKSEAFDLKAQVVYLDNEKKLQVTSGLFHTFGLIDQDNKIFKLQPIARAFAGAPKPHEVHGMSVVFSNQTSSSRTLKTYADDNIALTGTSLMLPSGESAIEYRVMLRTQDASKIVIPDEGSVSPVPVKAEVPKAKGGIPWYVWVLIGVGSIAAGCVIYFALCGLGRKRRPR